VLKTVVLSVSLFLILALSAFADEFDTDEIIVRLQPGVSIDTINARYNTTTTETEVPNSVFKVRVADPADLQTILAAMQTDVDLVWASLTYFGETPEGTRRTLAVIDGDPTPGEYFDQEVLTKMRVDEAQQISKGAGVVVAVIDTGVDYNHPDLTDHVLRDGGNVVIGNDFVSLDSDPMDETNGIDDDADGDTDEGAGHGTHVAGIIALIAPEAKIVPIRVLDTEGSGFADDVAAAIRWFIDPANVPGDKKIINLSLGIPNVDRVEIIHDVIDEVISEENLPIPVIASAGNDGLKEVHYPASEGDVFSVAAVDKNDVAAEFTNYKDVDFAAPGIADNNSEIGIYSTFINGQYATWAGTSMAAPFVTGLAALVKAIEPSQRGNEQLEDLIEETSDNIQDENPDIDLGEGRIDMLSALEEIGGSPSLVVKKAIYRIRSKKLIVTAKSDAGPTDTLTIQGFGTMTYKQSKKRFIFQLKPVDPMPTQITIDSALLGTSVTTEVKPKR
jgi:subtilisin family serine protease